MGAHSFTTWSHGKTADEAFRRACDEAEYEEGHNAYNGTISTNSDFFEVKIPAGSKLTHTTLEQLSWELEYDGPPKDPGIKRKFDHEWERNQHQHKRALYKLWQSLTPAERQVVERASRFQKWGPCICVEITGKEATEYKKRVAPRRMVQAGVSRDYYGRTVQQYETKPGRLPNGTKVFKFWGLASS